MKGFDVGLVMCALALATGTPPHPVPLIWILLSARWAYGADRYLDGKTDDSPEALIAALALAVAVLDARGLPEWALAESACLQAYGPIKRLVPCIKPFYVGAFWSGATCVVPHLMTGVDVHAPDVLSMALLTTAVSNVADIPDVDVDREDGIRTIPVMFGPEKARAFSAALGVSAGLIHFSSACSARSTMCRTLSRSKSPYSYMRRLSRRTKSRMSRCVKSIGQSSLTMR